MKTPSFETLSSALRTLDPRDPDYSDLTAFGALIGDARAVAVGESAHGVREFYQLKDRLFRYLVSEHGFTAFVQESGFPEALAVNDWILGGPGEIEAIAAAGICYSMDTEDFRDQFRWMREWNARHDRKIRFYGMDIAGSGTKPLAGIEASIGLLGSTPEDAGTLRCAQLGDRFLVARNYAAKPSADRDRLWSGLADLRARAQRQGDEVALRCVRAVEVLRPAIEGDALLGRSPDDNPRDAFMADTVRWILDREDRIMISAHNGHIVRGDFMGAPMLGKFLAPALGPDMVVVGTTYANGDVIRVDHMMDAGNWVVTVAPLSSPPESTLDAAMDAVPSDVHLVDLRTLSAADLAGSAAMLVFHDALPFDPKGFDALIHVRNVSTADSCARDICREAELGRSAVTAP